MPIYEYTCRDCGERFDRLVRTGEDEAGLACPACSRRRVAREMSVFAAHESGRRPTAALPVGGCGRCGDPNGPCGLE